MISKAVRLLEEIIRRWDV